MTRQAQPALGHELVHALTLPRFALVRLAAKPLHQTRRHHAHQVRVRRERAALLPHLPPHRRAVRGQRAAPARHQPPHRRARAHVLLVADPPTPVVGAEEVAVLDTVRPSRGDGGGDGGGGLADQGAGGDDGGNGADGLGFFLLPNEQRVLRLQVLQLRVERRPVHGLHLLEHRRPVRARATVLQSVPLPVVCCRLVVRACVCGVAKYCLLPLSQQAAAASAATTTTAAAAAAAAATTTRPQAHICVTTNNDDDNQNKIK